MSAPTVKSDALYGTLAPELRRLCASAPQYGELIFRATLHDGYVVKLSFGIETTRQAAPRHLREGGEI